MARQLDLSNSSPEDFEMLKKLGEGAYGSVYKARHIETDTILAIKVVLVGTDTQEEVQREIEFMKNFHCRQIVSYYGSSVHGASMWIIMDYCGLGSIRDVMDATETLLTEPEIAQTVADTLKGLKYLHENRVIHRDIKAANILINEEGVIKLADFGVSEQLKSDVMKTLNVIGTPLWMAPEVIADARYNTVADIWSLGITAIELAQGFPPNTDLNPFRAMFLIPRNPPPKLENPSSFTPDFNDFISKCLIKNPTKRWTAKKLLTHPFITHHVFSKEANLILPRFVANVQALLAASSTDDDQNEGWNDFPGSIPSPSDSHTQSPGLFQFKDSTDSLPTLSALMGSEDDDDEIDSPNNSGRSSPNIQNDGYNTLVIKPGQQPQESLLKRVTSPSTERPRSSSDSGSPPKSTSPINNKKSPFSRAFSGTLKRQKTRTSKPEVNDAHFPQNTPSKATSRTKEKSSIFKPSAFQTMLFGKKGPKKAQQGKKAKGGLFGTLKSNRKQSFMTIGAPTTNKHLTINANRRAFSGNITPTSTSDNKNNSTGLDIPDFANRKNGDAENWDPDALDQYDENGNQLSRTSSVIVHDTVSYSNETMVMGQDMDIDGASYLLSDAIIDDVMEDETMYSLEKKPLWQQRMIRYCAYSVIPEFPAAYIYQTKEGEFQNGEQHFGELKDNATHGLHGVAQDVSTTTPEPISHSSSSGISWTKSFAQTLVPRKPQQHLTLGESITFGNKTHASFSGISWTQSFDSAAIAKTLSKPTATPNIVADTDSLLNNILNSPLSLRYVFLICIFVFFSGMFSITALSPYDDNTTPIGLPPPPSIFFSPPETSLELFRTYECPTPICPKCSLRCPPPKQCPQCPIPGPGDEDQFNVELPPIDATATTLMRNQLYDLSPQSIILQLARGAAVKA